MLSAFPSMGIATARGGLGPRLRSCQYSYFSSVAHTSLTLPHLRNSFPPLLLTRRLSSSASSSLLPKPSLLLPPLPCRRFFGSASAAKGSPQQQTSRAKWREWRSRKIPFFTNLLLLTCFGAYALREYRRYGSSRRDIAGVDLFSPVSAEEAKQILKASLGKSPTDILENIPDAPLPLPTLRRCPICSEDVCLDGSKEYVVGLGRVWHPSCFRCTTCKRPLKEAACRDLEGSLSRSIFLDIDQERPYCSLDYALAFVSHCSYCRQAFAEETPYSLSPSGQAICGAHLSDPDYFECSGCSVLTVCPFSSIDSIVEETTPSSSFSVVAASSLRWRKAMREVERFLSELSVPRKYRNFEEKVCGECFLWNGGSTSLLYEKLPPSTRLATSLDPPSGPAASTPSPASSSSSSSFSTMEQQRVQEMALDIICFFQKLGLNYGIDITCPQQEPSTRSKNNNLEQLPPIALVNKRDMTELMRRVDPGGIHDPSGITIKKGLVVDEFHQRVQVPVKIVLRKGMSKTRIQSVLAHELVHYWIATSLENECSLPLQVEEGLCELFAYLYLSQKRMEPEVMFSIKFLEDNPSSITGEGFRAAYRSLQGRTLREFLSYVKRHHSFPPVLVKATFGGAHEDL